MDVFRVSFSFFLLLFIYCIKALHVSDKYVSQNKSSSTDPSVLCKNRRLFGGEEFNWCQPNNCTLLDTGNIDGTINDELFWIHGYVERLPLLLTYEDCFNSSHPQSIFENVRSQTIFENNAVFECSRYCVLERNGNIGNYIYLISTTCFCVSNLLHNSWLNSNIIWRTATDACNVRCPGRDLERCGGYDKIDQQHFTMYSVYVFAPDVVEDEEKGQIAHLCPHFDKDNILKYTDCHRKLQFNCQKYFASAENGIRIHQTCSNESLSWYEAEKRCAANDRYIQTYSKPTDCNGTNVPLWNGSFVPERIVWNSYPDQWTDMSSVLCLAVSAEQGDKFRLLSRNCTETHRAWCRKLENDLKMTTHTTEAETVHTSIFWYVMSPLLLLIVALAVVISLWRYRKVHRPNTAFHTNVTEEEVPYDRVNYSNMDAISPLPEPPTVMSTNDQRTVVASSRNDNPYLLSTDDEGYLNPYQPLTDDWRVSKHVYESTRKPSDYENGASLIAESENENACHEYESLNRAQPDDHVYA